MTRRDGTFSFQVPDAHCTVTAGWGLRNDDVQHEVVPMDPRTTLELDRPRTGVVLRLRS